MKKHLSPLISHFSFQSGFTLIELLVVMVIISILAMATIVAVNPARNINQARNSNVKSDMAQISRALLVYFTNNVGIYPADLQTLVTSGEINPVPQQPDGTDYGYQRSNVCDSTGCSAVLWGKLYDTSVNTFWCWDSISNKLKESPAEPAGGSTTCP